MQVTTHNFAALLPLITESLQTADFVALDTEFSGYSIGTEDKHHDYDSREERYQKIKFVC